MFKCHVCGGEAAKQEFVSDVFNVDERRALVEHIPALICERCGEATFSRETAERIRLLIHGHPHPVKTAPLEVFTLA